LKEIDLSPIEDGIFINYVNLSSNQLTSVDLSPFHYALHLRINLDDNPIVGLDLSPLLASQGLEIPPDVRLVYWYKSYHVKHDPQELGEWRFIYDWPVPVKYWGFLHRILNETKEEPGLVFQHDVLHAMGLGYLGFIDRDLRQEFLEIPRRTPLDQARDRITPLLLEIIVKQIDEKGLTTGLVLEDAGRHSEIAERWDKILDLRNSEIDRLILDEEHGEYYHGVNVLQLWLTALGYRILRTFDFRDITIGYNYDQFAQVNDAFNELGLSLNTNSSLPQKGNCVVEMSDELKRCILWMGVNKGKQTRYVPHENDFSRLIEQYGI